jgi:hypothetical protein
MLPVKGAILLKFKFFLSIPPVLFGSIIFSFTFAALQGHQFHCRLFTRHSLPLPASIQPIFPVFVRKPLFPDKSAKKTCNGPKSTGH